MFLDSRTGPALVAGDCGAEDPLSMKVFGGPRRGTPELPGGHTESLSLRRLDLTNPGPAAARERRGPRWHPAGVGEGASQEHLDLAIDAPELVRGPPRQGVVNGRVHAQQNRLALAGHE
jgi:hypothetical protein